MKLLLKNRKLFLVVVLIQVVIMVYYCNRKAGFFIDEIWTYNLSNGFYFPLLHNIGDLLNKWIPQSFWVDSLTASHSHSFEYASVLYNQAKDVHPPLYYIIIHTICSFFPGVFSKWFGLVPNIVFFVITQILIYKISKIFFKNNFFALLPCVVYGFSVGAINTVLFIRMYSMLTLISACCIYINLEFFYKEKLSIYLLFKLFICYIAGILTHYYFIIFAFFMSAFLLLFLAIRKDIHMIIYYVIASFMSVLLALVSWPSLIMHIFCDYRGEEAFKNALHSSFIDRILSFADICNGAIYIKYYTFVFLSILFFYFIYKSIKIKKNDNIINIKYNHFAFNINLYIDNRLFCFLHMVFSVFFTFLVVSKVAAYTNTRYIMYLYPPICIIVSIILIKICSLVTLMGRLPWFIVMILTVLNLQTKNIEYLYKIDKPVNALLQSSEPRRDFLVVTGYDNWWPSVQMIKFFVNSEKTYITTEDNNFSIPELKNGTILYIARTCKDKYIIDKIMKESGMSSYKEIYTEWHGKLYELKH